MFRLIQENFLLGIGANKELIRVGDNDYLFTLTQYGLIGFILKYGVYLFLYYKLHILTKRRYLFRYLWLIQGTKLSILLLFIAAFTLESFYNYYILTIILINAGFCISLVNKYKEEGGRNGINNNSIV
jgi:hypothetical protein